MVAISDEVIVSSIAYGNDGDTKKDSVNFITYVKGRIGCVCVYCKFDWNPSTASHLMSTNTSN